MGVIHFCRRANSSMPLTIYGTYSMDTGATISASLPESATHNVLYEPWCHLQVQAFALLAPDTPLTQVSNLRERQNHQGTVATREEGCLAPPASCKPHLTFLHLDSLYPISRPYYWMDRFRFGSPRSWRKFPLNKCVYRSLSGFSFQTNDDHLAPRIAWSVLILRTQALVKVCLCVINNISTFYKTLILLRRSIETPTMVDI